LITILAPYFSPAVKAGGPIKSLDGISKIFKKQGYPYTIITRNKDIDGSSLEKNKFQKNVVYTDGISRKDLQIYFRKSELIWINSLYSIPFSIQPILALFFLEERTVLISPRGQLLAGSVNFKKKLYLLFVRSLLAICYHKVVIHYTNKEEQSNSLSTFKRFDSVVFNNPISGVIKDRNTTLNTNVSIVLAVFGRVSPIKNIDFIINFLPLLDSEISLEIHGSIEDANYKVRLDELINSLGVSNRVSFCGNYNMESFTEKARKIDVVLIPSLSENFCHVFFEAIEMRKLVIGSSGLPWKDANSLVKNTILPLETEVWVKRIAEIAEMRTENYEDEQEKLVEFYKKIHASVQLETAAIFKKLMQTNEA